MTTIPFGEWTPDLGPLGNPGLMQARNCLPQANGYRSLSGLSVYVGPASLGDRVVGAVRLPTGAEQPLPTEGAGPTGLSWDMARPIAY